GSFQNVPHARDSAGSPVAVDVQGKEVIGQVVAGRDPTKHSAHPFGCLALGGRAGRCSSLHESAAWIAESTKSSAIPDSTVTSPILRGSTKWTLPWTVFLSATRRPNRLAAAMPSSVGIGP